MSGTNPTPANPNDTSTPPSYQQFLRQFKILIGKDATQSKTFPGTIVQANDPKLTLPTSQGGYSGSVEKNSDGTYSLTSDIPVNSTPTITNSPADAIDVSQLRVTFKITRDSVSSPNLCVCRVYNLSAATISRVQKEFNRLFIQVGYAGTQLSTIFNGTVIRMTRGQTVTEGQELDPHNLPTAFISRRESEVDTYLEFIASDGDQPYNYAIVSVSMEAGTSAQDQLNQIMAALKPFSVGLGYVDLAGNADQVLPRGVVLHGMVRDVLDDFCKWTKTTWSLQDNMIVIVQKGKYIPGNAIVISSKTGQVGLARQTIEGVEFTTLLNPFIRVNRIVQLVGSDGGPAQIQQAQPPTPLPGADVAVDPLNNPLDPTGFYRVLYYEHVGDTRGNPWYTNAIALGVTQTANAGSSIVTTRTT